MKKLFTLITLILLYSCDNRPSAFVEIRGSLHPSLKLKQGSYVYLFNAAEKGVIKDSARVQGNQFLFRTDPDPAWRPFLAKICYWDSTADPAILRSAKTEGYLRFLRPIGFHNPYKKEYIESLFYVDYGSTKLSPYISTDPNSKTFLHTVEPLKQSEPYFRHIALNIPDDSTYQQASVQISSVINKYPYSYALLDLLFKHRSRFRVKDLGGYIKLFDDELEAEKLFAPYFKMIQSSPKRSLEGLTLSIPSGSRQEVFNLNSKYTLLVFWASWCAPCRKEIPTLKKIRAQYPDGALQIVSISIDKNEEHWRKAVAMEKMPWEQFRVLKEDQELIDYFFRIDKVPSMFLVDRDYTIRSSFSHFPDSTFHSLLNRSNINIESPLTTLVRATNPR